MKTSFAEAAVTEAPSPDDVSAAAEIKNQPAAESSAVVPRETADLVPDTYFQNGEMEGDFDRSDIKIPKLNLVQSVGPLTEHFQPGHWVFNKETDLGQVPVEITLVKLRKYFIEDLPYGTESIPAVFDSFEQAAREGFRHNRDKWKSGKGGKPDTEGHYVKPVLEATVLVKAPTEQPSFVYERDGAFYTFALWTLQSVAYSRTATKFITAAGFALRKGLSTAPWSVTPKREKVGNNFIWLPDARILKPHTPEFVAWIKEIQG